MPRKKRRNKFRQFTIVALLCTGALVLWLYFNKVAEFFSMDRETNFTLYPGFGIQIPNGYAIHGIDVSRYQQQINWPMVKQMKEKDVRLGFAFIKATEGIRYTDGSFKRNWRKARENRLTRGAYHFFVAYRDGKKQAEHFINTVNLLPGDLPPVLDVETLDGTSASEMQKNVKAWLKTIEAYYHVKPIIYSNASFYNNYLHDQFSNYPLWVAHYLEPRQPRVSREWKFWQHNEGGRVNGIYGFVDFNVFNGDSTEFSAMLVK